MEGREQKGKGEGGDNSRVGRRGEIEEGIRDNRLEKEGRR